MEKDSLNHGGISVRTFVYKLIFLSKIKKRSKKADGNSARHTTQWNFWLPSAIHVALI